MSEDEEGLRVAWAPGLYAALLWAWAPRLDEVSVEYHYLRTGPSRPRRADPDRGRRDARLGPRPRVQDRRGPRRPGGPGGLPAQALDGVWHLPVGEPMPRGPRRARGDGRGRRSLTTPRPAGSPGCCSPVRRGSGGSASASSSTCRTASRWHSTASSSGSSRRRAGTTRRPSSARPRTPARIPGPSWPPMGGPSRPSSSAGRTWSRPWPARGPLRRRGSGTGRPRMPPGVHAIRLTPVRLAYGAPDRGAPDNPDGPRDAHEGGANASRPTKHRRGR